MSEKFSWLIDVVNHSPSFVPQKDLEKLLSFTKSYKSIRGANKE